MITNKEKILRVLSSQDFADWYGWAKGTADALGTQHGSNKPGRFEMFIEGAEKAPTEKEILKDIERMFGI